MRFRVVSSSTNHSSCCAYAIISDRVISCLYPQVGVSANFQVYRFYGRTKSWECARCWRLVYSTMVTSDTSDQVTASSFAGTYNNKVAVVYNFCVNDRGTTRFKRFASRADYRRENYFSTQFVIVNYVFAIFLSRTGSYRGLFNRRARRNFCVCASVMISNVTIGNKVAGMTKRSGNTYRFCCLM